VHQNRVPVLIHTVHGNAALEQALNLVVSSKICVGTSQSSWWSTPQRLLPSAPVVTTTHRPCRVLLKTAPNFLSSGVCPAFSHSFRSSAVNVTFIDSARANANHFVTRMRPAVNGKFSSLFPPSSSACVALGRTRRKQRVSGCNSSSDVWRARDYYAVADVRDVSGAADDIIERALSSGGCCFCCCFSASSLASSSSCSFLFFSPFLISFISFSISRCCSSKVLFKSLLAWGLNYMIILLEIKGVLPCVTLKSPLAEPAHSNLHYP
jgi:hypothetical protein